MAAHIMSGLILRRLLIGFPKLAVESQLLHVISISVDSEINKRASRLRNVN